MIAAFRSARAEDVPMIVTLLADDALGRAREVASDPAYAAAFDAIDRDPNQLLAVAVIDAEIVGTLQISFIPGLSLRGGWRGQIEAVRIAASRRSEGLGEQMMLWAIGRCRARGCRLVQLTTNVARQDAHRFYERLGFDRSHVGYKLALNAA